jgi:hypothetical protein
MQQAKRNGYPERCKRSAGCFGTGCCSCIGRKPIRLASKSSRERFPSRNLRTQTWREVPAVDRNRSSSRVKGNEMYRPEISKFQYTRTRGKHRTYDVTLNVVQKDSGVCVYVGWVQFQHDFKGSGLVLPLIANTRYGATREARLRIEKDIEDLAGIVE